MYIVIVSELHWKIHFEHAISCKKIYLFNFGVDFNETNSIQIHTNDENVTYLGRYFMCTMPIIHSSYHRFMKV